MKTNFSQRGQRYHYDILVVGSGIAGLSYILQLKQQSPELNIALICKKNLDESNSRYAQGGMAAIALDDDSFKQHIQDTVEAGDGLCSKKTVENIIQAAPEAIELLKTYGVNFDEHLSREGGHAKRRVYHVGDHTGKAIIASLLTQLNNVDVFENHTAVNLITHHEKHKPGSQNQALGAYVLDEKTGKIHTFLSKVTVLATGGAGKVYRYTSNPEVATGDGIAMAYRAGARLGNMEFYQFHPTVLYHPKLNNFLITEALRGEGAHLLNPDTLTRFMQNYDAKKLELSTRDVVSRAIFTEIERSEKNYVYLDVRHLDAEFLEQRFPTIFKTLLGLGIDIRKDLIPVVPAAHYLCGGILTDITGQTDLNNLYAIGETAFTGLHGANRLASNSLLEGAVMAKQAAESTLKQLENHSATEYDIQDWDSESVRDSRRASQIHSHWRGLRGEMSSYAGIVRTAAGLKDVLRLIQTRRDMIEDYYWRHSLTSDVIELRNIALVAELIVHSALRRKESRGGHFREDYPKKKRFKHQESIVKHNDVALMIEEE